jgi:outer membrane immunogenic protein
MRKIATGLLSTVSWLSLAATAGAADLVTKAPALAPQSAPIWSGPYVGFDVGGYYHRASSNDETFGLVPGFSGSLTDTSAFASAHAGYNWQAGRVVFGVEADITSPSRRASISFGPVGFVPRPETFTTEIRWLSTFRGRVGVAFSDLLLYATGGLAVADISNIRSDPAVLGFIAKDERVRTAAVVGGGVEYKFNRQWSARVEGLWMKFPDSTVNSIGFGNPALAYRTRFTNEVAMVRGGVSLSW